MFSKIKLRIILTQMTLQNNLISPIKLTGTLFSDQLMMSKPTPEHESEPAWPGSEHESEPAWPGSEQQRGKLCSL